MQTEEFAFEGMAWSVSNSPKTISHQSLQVIYASTSAGVVNVRASRQPARYGFQTKTLENQCSVRIGVTAPVTQIDSWLECAAYQFAVEPREATPP